MKYQHNEPQPIGAAMDTVHKLMNRAEEPRRKIKSTAKPKKPLRARFKADFYFQDGNRAILYSLDYIKRAGETILDEYEGLNKLYRLIHKWSEQGKLHTVSIYVNLDVHPLTETKNYNSLLHRVTPKIIRADGKIVNNGTTIKFIALEYPEITSLTD